jgi:hypothetical protein
MAAVAPIPAVINLIFIGFTVTAPFRIFRVVPVSAAAPSPQATGPATGNGSRRRGCDRANSRVADTARGQTHRGGLSRVSPD